MKTDTVRNGSLALVGLAALTVYILACTSFSPDDKKVLYPAFDPLSGTVGVAEYDRENARSRMLFVPMVYEETNRPATPLVRPQWLGNGRRVLVSWVAADADDRLNLAVLPVAGESAVRLFALPLDDSAQSLMIPLAVAGQEAVLKVDDQLLRINLSTGVLAQHELSEADDEFYVYPGFDEGTVFYLTREKEPRKYAFGRLNPETFARTPQVTFTNEPSEGSFFAYNERGNRLALVQDAGGGQELVVLEAGKPPATRQISAKEKYEFGSGIFLEKRSLVLASYMRKGDGTSAFGLLEIPLEKSESIRDTVLIPDAGLTDDEAAFYFQAGVSHDGKTAAVSSTYLACMGKGFKPENCALFFVDLSDPKRKVTRVPIPLPSERPGSPLK
jgi:hypothetical protein